MPKILQSRIAVPGPTGLPGEIGGTAGTTTFNANGSITQTTTSPISTTSTATFNPDGTITTTYGAPLSRTVVTTFNADGSITEAVT